MKIASIQMVSGCDLTHNLDTASELLQRTADEDCLIAVLPEYFCLLGKSDTDKLQIQEPFGSGPIQDRLSNLAITTKQYIVAGTIPLSTEHPDRVWNASLVFSPAGNVIARYNKIHLFSFTTNTEHYDESRVLAKGSEPCTFSVPTPNYTWKFGLSICYDIRFPELYRTMGPVDCHLLPAAFTYTTGQAHWEILLRARAIENQSYMVSSAQGGTHENGRKTWGHSMIISPWGEIQASFDTGEGFITSDLNLNVLEETRTKLPALQHQTL